MAATQTAAPRANTRFKNIPVKMRERKQWVIYKNEGSGEHVSHVPYQPKEHIAGAYKYHASCQSPHGWVSFDEAIREVHAGRADGISFVLTIEAGIVGVDLDDVRDPATGEIEPWAQKIIEDLNSYTEVSPSGAGIRIFGQDDIFSPFDPRLAKKHGRAEIYRDAKILTVTGNVLGERRTLNMIAAGSLQQKLATLDPNPPKPTAASGSSGGSESELDWKLISQIREDHPEFTPAQVEEEFRARDPERYSAQNAKHSGHVRDGGYVMYSIGRHFEQVTPKKSKAKKVLQMPPTETCSADTEAEVTATRARHPLTELGNSRRLVDAFGDVIKFCHQRKSWYVWTGDYWKRDETGQIIEVMKIVADKIIDEAMAEQDAEKRKKIFGWWAQSQKRFVIVNSIALAQSVVPILPDEFDSDPHLLNVSNGTLDLRTSTLHPHRREDLISKIAPVEYHPGAGCPRWEKFISEVMPDRATQQYLQRAVGYTLTGSNIEHAFFVLWGSGRNGKSTFLKTAQALLGDYAKQADFQSFTEGEAGSIRNDIARLEGARLVCATEGKQNGRLAENIIKFLTGGDKVAARFLYQEHREFVAQLKLWLGTNHKPRIIGTDVAIWSRVRLVPFTESFLGREDRELGDKLLAELPGILNWALEGLRQYQARGLDEPEHVKLATKDYRRDSDQIGRFFTACTVRGEEDTPKKALYSRYKMWVLENGEYQFTERAFSESMIEHGYQDRHTKKGMVWIGIEVTG